jgi:hypothetical protein
VTGVFDWGIGGLDDLGIWRFDDWSIFDLGLLENKNYQQPGIKPINSGLTNITMKVSFLF